jgi:uroporphyrinogen-III synthase
MLTSANAARFGGDALASYRDLPCYAVGETTAEAALGAGFRDVRTGPADGEALLAKMVGDGVRDVLHLAGRDRLELRHPDLRLDAVTVYAADALDRLPAEAEAAIARGALVLLHSPRAAARFAALAGARRGAIRIASISAQAAEAAGDGWAGIAVAERPRDEALLELAAKLCQNHAG